MQLQAKTELRLFILQILSSHPRQFCLTFLSHFIVLPFSAIAPLHFVYAVVAIDLTKIHANIMQVVPISLSFFENKMLN